MGCLFCDIISGATPSKKVFENESAYAFDDIHPQSPVHVLVVPKLHIEKIEDLNRDNAKVLSDIFLAVKDVAALKGIDKNGYRVIINNGKSAGQVIWHLHVHVMGGTNDLGPMLAK